MKNKKITYLLLATMVVLVVAGVAYSLAPSASNSPTEKVVSDSTVESTQKVVLEVAIPCQGHSPLIMNELNKIDGVEKIDYSPISTFTVYYNPEKTSKERILSTKIFQEFPAREMM
ncbi:Uncharacterised protein [uncultured archaeon]|nr:Uncharacterised protein [uncultured archaeon]